MAIITPFPAGVLPQLPQAHGVLVLNKPQGPTSARCLTTIKRMGQRKIGHAGTLDPMASGVLLVLLGHATKISGHLMADGGKGYAGELLLGQATDTWDAEGTVQTTAPWEHLNEAAVRHAVEAWQGEYLQDVPPYSAAKHEGKALYTLARQGKDAPEKTKSVQISHAEVLSVNLPYVRFRVQCSSGTYIRSLAHSLGARLGCGATLTELTREYSHPFDLQESHTLESLVAAPEMLARYVLPITRALPHWPVYSLLPAEEATLRNGVAQVCDASRCIRPADGDRECGITVGDKAILQNTHGIPMALAEAQGHKARLCWSVLRGLW
ncbi:MAG: tRNA pseudouridine(55) synthase TruB [Desulfovibrionaceae bacterium]